MYTRSRRFGFRCEPNIQISRIEAGGIIKSAERQLKAATTTGPNRACIEKKESEAERMMDGFRGRASGNAAVGEVVGRGRHDHAHYHCRHGWLPGDDEMGIAEACWL